MSTTTLPYRPSSGTEGELFQQDFCDRCAQCQPALPPCDILVRSLFLNITDSDYPREWVQDGEGSAWCTVFVAQGPVEFAHGVIVDERQIGMAL